VNSKTEKTKPIPVRLSDLTRGRLDKAAKRLSSTRAGVIRFAISQLLPDVEAGRINLKPDTTVESQ